MARAGAVKANRRLARAEVEVIRPFRELAAATRIPRRRVLAIAEAGGAHPVQQKGPTLGSSRSQENVSSASPWTMVNTGFSILLMPISNLERLVDWHTVHIHRRTETLHRVMVWTITSWVRKSRRLRFPVAI